MDELRKVPFLIALGALLIAVLVEAGATHFLPHAAPDAAKFRSVIEAQQSDPEPDIDALQSARQQESEPPGQAIPALVWLDGLLLLTIGLMGAALVVPERIMGRIQAPFRLVASFLLILAGVKALITAYVLLMLMVSLFLAAPFGTIAYLAMWGFFDRGSATAALAIVMFLKLVFAICLVISQPSFLKGKMLVVLTLTSLVANVVVSFLHGFVPGILVSITDALGAVIVAILAIIWGLIIFIGVIVPTIKSFRLEHESS
jgi:hypothetical protein